MRAIVLLAVCFFAAPWVSAAEQAHAIRFADADVTVHITLAGGSSVTRRLEPMTIAGQPGFGGFVSVGAPGIYTIRFEVRRPGAAGVASAAFEHRVSRELR